LYGDWLRQREVEEDGVILVRPDKHIAWRSHRLVEDPEHALTAVLSSILSRGGNDNAEEVARLMAAAKVAVG
ncbi:MAG: phenol 2-monooxygenase, partial [Corynebacterium pollutisoli]|nr:phenol 2-monooxygenase [Corynebacterium pollutisoli]